MSVSGITDDRIYKIYNYTQNISPENFHLPPFDVNYNILSLHKKRYFDKGEIYRVEYYGKYEFLTDTYSDMVLHEDRTYYRINEMVYKRDIHICWRLSDETTGSTKNTTKYYTKEESYGVGERRRRNCVTNIKIATIGLLIDLSGITQQEAENIGLVFLSDVGDEIQLYIEGVDSALKNRILTITGYDWLDEYPPMLGGLYTIREYLYSELNIDYTINNVYM